MLIGSQIPSYTQSSLKETDMTPMVTKALDFPSLNVFVINKLSMSKAPNAIKLSVK